MATTPKGFRLPNDLVAALNKKAADANLSPSALVIAALRIQLNVPEPAAQAARKAKQT